MQGDHTQQLLQRMVDSDLPLSKSTGSLPRSKGVKYLNLVSNTDFTTFLKCNLVEWYAAAPKNDRRAAPGEEADEEANPFQKSIEDDVYKSERPHLFGLV